MKSIGLRCCVVVLLLVFLSQRGSCCVSQGCGQSNGYCPAFALPYSQYQSDYTVNTFLGSRVTARAYSSGGKGAFISKDLDLLCQDFKSCQWKNDDNDQLDWVLGEGNVDADKVKMVTGSDQLPGRDFFILASDARHPSDSGILISDPISCQKEQGVLTLELWRSRARVPGQEPDLDICIKKVGSTELEYCQTVEPDRENLIRAQIPPTQVPFHIVIKGYGFENSPEGGLIIIDHISYAASVENIANCESDFEGNLPYVPLNEENDIVQNFTEYRSATASTNIESNSTVMLIDSDSAMEKSNLRNTLNAEFVRRIEQFPEYATKSQDISNSNSVAYESCLLLKCTGSELSKETMCGYSPVGEGARGDGLSGWNVVDVTLNNANRLTGVHGVPPSGNPFVFVAPFRSRSLNRSSEVNRFVLESPYLEFSTNQKLYFAFRRYIAIHGIELALCSDGEANECFYRYPQPELPYSFLKSRSWTTEKVQLPTNLNKLFIIAQTRRRFKQNAGQIGLADMQLFYDDKATESVC
ncbi:hypothetical protein QR680_001956 [Steinernema hermaphroditum]|uniref:MAM domain-containing protein n=1 Tax=Steinernema hermaphroditum TaxID=289476 RepID=A0AA39LGN9_9BILA|nr:hypothetical protein QR680_001956 [Steinernema hermaphroditum]